MFKPLLLTLIKTILYFAVHINYQTAPKFLI